VNTGMLSIARGYEPFAVFFNEAMNGKLIQRGKSWAGAIALKDRVLSAGRSRIR